MGHPIDVDRNLLFGVMALQAGLIDSRKFIDACTLWTTGKDVALADLLVQNGSLVPADKSHIEYLVERNLQQHRGDSKASLADAPDQIKRSLAALVDADIHRSLAELPREHDDPLATTVVTPQPRRYTLGRLHATGGLGRIWVAHDREIERDVALKELRPEQAGNEVLRKRFLKEAQITGQLEHPGIVPVYELSRWDDDQHPFYAMRLIRGHTLTEAAQALHEMRQRSQAEPLEFLTLLNAFVAVCNTVAYAHSRGVIHRDLKGQNVVLGDFGEVVVLDWGLAKVVGGSEAEPATYSFNQGSGGPTAEALTIQGQTLGTPAYMAPEQAAGRLDEIDARTDVYGLGAMLYEILTGRPPFRGFDTAEVLKNVCELAPTPPRCYWADVPQTLEGVCLRALAKKPGDRYRSASALAQDVQQWQEVQRRQAEEALRASEALYHSLVETLPLNVWRKDAQGHFSFANNAFAEATKRPLSELIGATDFDLFPPELAEKYRHDDAMVRETGQTLEATEEHLRADGEKLHVRVVKIPIRDANGEVVGTQGVFWDVSDRQRLEEKLGRTLAELEALKRRSEQSPP
jgi:PAS domain S-box-containing protein